MPARATARSAPYQRRSDQGFQYDLRRPGPGGGRYRVRSADGLGQPRHERSIHGAGGRRRAGHQSAWTKSSWPARLIDQVKRRFRRQDTVLQGQYPEREADHGLDLRSRLQGDRADAARPGKGGWNAGQAEASALRYSPACSSKSTINGRWRRAHRGRLRQTRAGTISQCAVLGRDARSIRTARRSGPTGPAWELRITSAMNPS